MLEKAHVITTPGSGFGTEGEGYLRLSAFGSRETIKHAINSIQKNFTNRI
jgi:LL-diaminopimelate aminotransferase